MMKFPILVISMLLAVSIELSAQNNTTDPNTTTEDQNQDSQRGGRGFWEANLPGGNYVVALSRVISVSRHKYVLDGTIIVDEVTIDTEGQALARFYFLSPATAAGPSSATAELAERAVEAVNNLAQEKGSTLQDMVVKKYPVTTHAKTVEYRLLSEAQLTALYQSAKTSWQTGVGRLYTVK